MVKYYGYSDGTFLPDQGMNRAELTKVLVAGKGIEPDSEIYKNCFLDVNEEWFAKYVCYAKENEWIEGYPNDYFLPANFVNEVEAMKIIFEPLFNGQWNNLSQEEIEETLEFFHHVDSSQWYAKYLTFGIEKHLLFDSFPGLFKPEDFTSRGLVSEYLFRSKLVSENNWTEYHPYSRDLFFKEKGFDDLVDENFPCYSWGGHNDFPFYNDYLISEYGMKYPFFYDSGGEAELYGLGNFCALGSNGTVFSNVTFVLQENQGKIGEHHVIVFDEKDELKGDLTVPCQPAGDYADPVLEWTENNEFFFSCVGGDAGFYFKETYLLDLDTLEYELYDFEGSGSCRELEDRPTDAEYSAAAQQAVEELDTEGLLQGSEYKFELVMERMEQILNLCSYEALSAQMNYKASTDACVEKSAGDICSFTDTNGENSGMCQDMSEVMVCTP